MSKYNNRQCTHTVSNGDRCDAVQEHELEHVAYAVTMAEVIAARASL